MEFHCELLWINFLIFIAGSYILIKGSDIFVDSAAEIARFWKVSELVIGLTLVSIGTSLPELSTSMYAQCFRESDFVIGNICGSIVTNITLVLGAALLIGGGMTFPMKLLKRDVLIMNILFIVTTALFFLTKVPAKNPGDAPVFGLNALTGALLLIGAIVYCVFLVKHPGEVEEEAPAPRADGKERSGGVLLLEFLRLLLGLAMIVIGSKAMVDTVVWGAEQLKINTMIISATIVAFGTSVPELAVTLAGILKGRHDLALGNIIGSCSFNIFLIFGACALINPLGINSGMTGIINTALIVFSGLILALFMYTGRKLSRSEGAMLVLCYLAFLAYNTLSALHLF